MVIKLDHAWTHAYVGSSGLSVAAETRLARRASHGNRQQRLDLASFSYQWQPREGLHRFREGHATYMQQWWLAIKPAQWSHMFDSDGRRDPQRNSVEGALYIVTAGATLHLRSDALTLVKRTEAGSSDFYNIFFVC